MKVLNFGSLNMDYIYYVDSFLRPGETKSARRMEEHFGGKGFNQSTALAMAGAEVYHAGNAGSDSEKFAAELKRVGANASFLARGTVTCGHAIIQVDRSGQNCILLFGGANQSITEDEADKVLANFSRGDILLLQNEINLNPYIIDRAAEIGMRIALNPSPFTADILKLPLEKLEWLLVNEIEAADISGCNSPGETAKWFGKHYEGLKIVLTLGRQGALYIADGTDFAQCSYGVKTVDTTGAGDVFTGFFLAGQAGGLTPEKSMDMAARAAAISVTRTGAAPSTPTMTEVESAALERYEV